MKIPDQLVLLEVLLKLSKMLKTLIIRLIESQK